MLRMQSEESRKVSDLVSTIKNAICLPMHEASQVKLEFESIGFWGQGRTGVPGEKPSGAKKRIQQQPQPTCEGVNGVAALTADGYFFPILTVDG